MIEANNPYLSIVIAARNDNYGGDFNQRLQNSLDWNSYYLEKHKIESEIIIVNYNPVLENSSLVNQLAFSTNRKHLTIKVITADEAIHKSYHDDTIRKKLHFYEFPAKNIGIRRASGKYILSTNADVIIHPSIFRFIAKKGLQLNCFYRTDRADYTKSETQKPLAEEFIRQCKKNTFLYSAKGFKYNVNSFLPFQLQLLAIKMFNQIRIQWELFKEIHQTKLSKFSIYHNPHNAEFKYHVTNCGDFMLMHRIHWFNLKGNPEKTFISTHADAQFVIMAGVYGLKEEIFFSPVFHQEHERRFDLVDIDNHAEFRKIYLTFQEKAQAMIASQKVIIDNDDNWGAANVNLIQDTF